MVEHIVPGPGRETSEPAHPKAANPRATYDSMYTFNLAKDVLDVLFGFMLLSLNN